jgi:hypothetical protein
MDGRNAGRLATGEMSIPSRDSSRLHPQPADAIRCRPMPLQAKAGAPAVQGCRKYVIALAGCCHELGISSISQRICACLRARSVLRHLSVCRLHVISAGGLVKLGSCINSSSSPWSHQAVQLAPTFDEPAVFGLTYLAYASFFCLSCSPIR